MGLNWGMAQLSAKIFVTFDPGEAGIDVELSTAPGVGDFVADWAGGQLWQVKRVQYNTGDDGPSICLTASAVPAHQIR